MTIRIPHALAGALCVGCALANLARPAFAPALGVAAVLGAVGLAAVDPRVRWPALALALVAGAWGWGSIRLAQLDRSVLAPRIGTFEPALVEVEEPPRTGSFDQRMRALVLRWGTVQVHEPVLLELPLGRAPPQGARLRLIGGLRAPPGPSNGFDEATWLRRQGIHAVLRVQTWHVVGRRGGVSGIGDRVGRWLAADSAAGLGGERRDVIEAIVLGRSSGLDQELLGDFRASGLYHCLAVDGLKVAAVGGGVAAVVLLAGLGSYLAQIGALLTVAAYALAVGLHPSVVRAALAAGLGSLAWLAARERDRWQALLVGAAVLLAWNPYALLDAGFQLSFAAVAAIFVVTPRVVRALEGYPVSHELAQLIGVSTACGLATAPVTWFQFHQISLVTVPANVVAVPLVVEVLGLALLTAAVAPVAPAVASALAQLNGWGAWLVAVCARAFGSLPGAQITSPRAAVALALGAVGAAAYAWRRGERARAEAGLPPDGDGPAEDRDRAPAAAGTDP
ncbi:MAG TPA: ComEC/Rec2 family competence protein [Gaiellaceae bacterium]|nr:ComEC/Rec2 family competence protein [Gaiellaceae bacterium]